MMENKNEVRGRGPNLWELFDHWREEGGEEGMAGREGRRVLPLLWGEVAKLSTDTDTPLPPTTILSLSSTSGLILLSMTRSCGLKLLELPKMQLARQKRCTRVWSGIT